MIYPDLKSTAAKHEASCAPGEEIRDFEFGNLLDGIIKKKIASGSYSARLLSFRGCDTR